MLSMQTDTFSRNLVDTRWRMYSRALSTTNPLTLQCVWHLASVTPSGVNDSVKFVLDAYNAGAPSPFQCINHHLRVGSAVKVSGVGAPFDGLWRVSQVDIDHGAGYVGFWCVIPESKGLEVTPGEVAYVTVPTSAQRAQIKSDAANTGNMTLGPDGLSPDYVTLAPGDVFAVPLTPDGTRFDVGDWFVKGASGQKVHVLFI